MAKAMPPTQVGRYDLFLNLTLAEASSNRPDSNDTTPQALSGRCIGLLSLHTNRAAFNAAARQISTFQFFNLVGRATRGRHMHLRRILQSDVVRKGNGIDGHIGNAVVP